MFCSKCGGVIENDAVFCDKCGGRNHAAAQTAMGATYAPAEVTQAAMGAPYAPAAAVPTAVGAPCAPAPVKKHKVAVLIVIFAVLALLLAAGAFVFFLLPSVQSDETGKSSISFIYDDVNLSTAVVYNNRLLDERIPGDVTQDSFNIQLYNYSFNDDTATVITRDDALYCVRRGSIHKIADNVEEYSCITSTTGGGVVYGAEGNMYLYDTSSGESSVIYSYSPDYAGQNGNFWIGGGCISPDGKNVLYQNSENGKLYVYSDGENTEITGKFHIAIAVSDGGEYIYYKDFTTGYLYVRNKEGNTKEIALRTETYSTNIDNSQIFFSDREGNGYIYNSKTDELISLSCEGLPNKLRPLCSGERTSYGFDGAEYKEYFWSYCYYTSVEDLTNCFYTGVYGGLLYVDDNGNVTKYDATYTECIGNGSAVYFKNRDGHSYTGKTLCYVSLDDPSSVEEIAEINSFGITEDEKNVFYITNDKELWRLDENRKKTRLDTNASIYDMESTVDPLSSGREIGFPRRIIGNSKLIYSSDYGEGEDGTLYICDINGSKKKLDFTAEEISFLRDYRNNRYREYDLFRPSSYDVIFCIGESWYSGPRDYYIIMPDGNIKPLLSVG